MDSSLNAPHPLWTDGTPILVGQTGTFSGVDENSEERWSWEDAKVLAVTLEKEHETGGFYRTYHQLTIDPEDRSGVFDLGFMCVTDAEGNRGGDTAVRRTGQPGRVMAAGDLVLSGSFRYEVVFVDHSTLVLDSDTGVRAVMSSHVTERFDHDDGTRALWPGKTTL